MAVVASVVVANANVGMAAFVAAVVLAVVGVADHDDAVRRMPRQVIVVVCGVGVLISLLEKTGGLDLPRDARQHLDTR